MKNVLFGVLSIIGACGAVLCGIQTGMAIGFGELGRVVIYLVGLILCGELAGYSIYRIIKARKT